MQKPRNPLMDCLRILAVFSGLAGVYALYKLFEMARPILTPGDIRLLLWISLAVSIISLVVLLGCFLLFFLEGWLRLLLQLKKLKSPNPLASETERLYHLEFITVSALERLENRLVLLEGKIGEELTLPAKYRDFMKE